MSKVQFVVDLLRTAFANCNTEVAKYKAMADQASAEAATQSARANDLQAALEAGQIEHAKALAAAQAEGAKDLDTITTELQNLINPSLGSDSVSEAVKESPMVETPAIVEASAAVGQPVETPAAVVEAAVEAIEATVDAAIAAE